MERIVIVGASVAGIRAAEVLRQSGFEGTITVLDAQRHLPYDKPPLSKAILTGVLQPEQIVLRRTDALDALELDLRLGTGASGIDLVRRTVQADEDILFDGLIIATGSRARRVAAWDQFDGVHVLRSLDDAIAVRDAFTRSPRRVVIVGAGFIGLEVASSARSRGLDVTVVEPLSAPVVRGLGTQMGHVVAGLHRDHGVDLRLGVGVDRLDGGRHVEGVRLSDGTNLEADIVLVGIGAAPTTDWLANSGLAIDDGVLTDGTLRAAPGVYVAGDICRWDDGERGPRRIEHWTNAAEQGEQAARNLLRESRGEALERFVTLPYVWSDQHKTKIQVLGQLSADDEVRVVIGATDDRKFVALYGRNGRVTGALAMAMPKPLMGFRSYIDGSWQTALDHAATLT